MAGQKLGMGKSILRLSNSQAYASCSRWRQACWRVRAQKSQVSQYVWRVRRLQASNAWGAWRTEAKTLSAHSILVLKSVRRMWHADLAMAWSIWQCTSMDAETLHNTVSRATDRLMHSRLTSAWRMWCTMARTDSTQTKLDLQVSLQQIQGQVRVAWRKWQLTAKYVTCQKRIVAVFHIASAWQCWHYSIHHMAGQKNTVARYCIQRFLQVQMTAAWRQWRVNVTDIMAQKSALLMHLARMARSLEWIAWQTWYDACIAERFLRAAQLCAAQGIARRYEHFSLLRWREATQMSRCVESVLQSSIRNRNRRTSIHAWRQWQIACEHRMFATVASRWFRHAGLTASWRSWEGFARARVHRRHSEQGRDCVAQRWWYHEAVANVWRTWTMAAVEGSRLALVLRTASSAVGQATLAGRTLLVKSRVRPSGAEELQTEGAWASLHLLRVGMVWRRYRACTAGITRWGAVLAGARQTESRLFHILAMTTRACVRRGWMHWRFLFLLFPEVLDQASHAGVVNTGISIRPVPSSDPTSCIHP